VPIGAQRLLCASDMVMALAATRCFRSPSPKACKEATASPRTPGMRERAPSHFLVLASPRHASPSRKSVSAAAASRLPPFPPQGTITHCRDRDHSAPSGAGVYAMNPSPEVGNDHNTSFASEKQNKRDCRIACACASVGCRPSAFCVNGGSSFI